MLNRPLGRGGGRLRGRAARRSLHRGKPGIVLGVLRGEEGRDEPPWSEVCAAFRRSPTAASCVSAGRSFPELLRTACGGLWGAGPSGWLVTPEGGLLFFVSPQGALAQRSGIPHLGASRVFSLFAYYNTPGPASSDRKVKSPPPREYRRSWRLARLIAERSTPVLVRAAGPMPGTAGGWPCACVGRVPWGCLSLSRSPRAVGHPPRCPAGAGGCCGGWGSFAWSCSSGLVLVRGRG